MPIDPNNLATTAKLTFADEFNSLSIWNGSNGTWSTNWWYNDEWGLYKTSKGGTLTSNGEKQWYINDNYAATSSVNPWTVSSGVLSITAQPTDPAIAGLINNYAYTSGMLNTWHSFSQQYGYFEISAKMPAGQGLWPAFWLLPQDGSWPPEIDIFEILGHDTKTLYTHVHTKEDGTHESEGAAIKTVDLSLAFHRYGVDWQDDYITFYLDGKQVSRFETPADLHKPMYMIANLAVGGYWPGNPNASTVFPAKLQIDYIHVYSELPATVTPTPVATPPVVTTPVVTTPVVTPPVVADPNAPLKLQGGAVADNLIGAGGNDVILGVAGNDTLQGGDGADRIEGDTGDDRIHGNLGADSVYGGEGADWVLGGQGSDLVYGDMGDDFTHGNIGDDVVWGGGGADVVLGGQGADSLSGGDGADWISGDRGADTVSGGAGADTFHAFDGSGLDRVLDFSLAEGDRVHLSPGTSYSFAQVGGDTVISVGAGSQMVLVGVQAATLTGDWLVMS